MAKMGMGAWYNPDYNAYEMLSSIQFHQDSIINRDVQVELGVEDHPAIEALMDDYKNWDDGEFEQKARIMGLLAGLMRIREYTNPNMISVELYHDGDVKTKLNRLRQFVGPKNLETKKSYSGEYMVGRNPLTNMFYTSLTGGGKLQITSFKENDGDVEIGIQQTFTDYDDFINNTMLENKKIIQEGIMSDKELGKNLEECVKMTESIRNDLYYVSQTGKMIKDKQAQEKPDPNRRYNGLDHFLENMNKIDMFRDQLMNESVLEEELSLSRVYSLANNKDTTFACISAWRHTNDIETNRKRQNVLKELLHSRGYGYKLIDGFWIEAGENIPYPPEESLFTACPKDKNPNEFINFLNTICLSRDTNENGEKERFSAIEDDEVPSKDDVLNSQGMVNFGQDAIAIKPAGRTDIMYFQFWDGTRSKGDPLNFYANIEKNIDKMSPDARAEAEGKAGGLGYSTLKRRKGRSLDTKSRSGSFRTGKLDEE